MTFSPATAIDVHANGYCQLKVKVIEVKKMFAINWAFQDRDSICKSTDGYATMHKDQSSTYDVP